MTFRRILLAYVSGKSKAGPPAAGDAIHRLLTPPSRRIWRSAVLLTVALVAALLWLAALSQPDGRLHLYFLDVGQGDAILLRTPNGHNILVDGGPDPRTALSTLDRRLPLWDRQIDLAVLTHADTDHLAGLVALAQRGRLQQVLEPPREESPSTLYLRWDRALDDGLVPRWAAVMGQVIQTTDGVRIEVLNPPSPPLVGTSRDRNNNGVVLWTQNHPGAARGSVAGATDLESKQPRLLVHKRPYVLTVTPYENQAQRICNPRATMTPAHCAALLRAFS